MSQDAQPRVKYLPHPRPSDIKLERVIYALGDPLRLSIIRQLNHIGVASCGELTGGRPKSSMSHHFGILRAAGLLSTRLEGTAHRNELRRSELDVLFPGLLDTILKASGLEEAREANARGSLDVPPISDSAIAIRYVR